MQRWPKSGGPTAPPPPPPIPTPMMTIACIRKPHPLPARLELVQLGMNSHICSAKTCTGCWLHNAFHTSGSNWKVWLWKIKRIVFIAQVFWISILRTDARKKKRSLIKLTHKSCSYCWVGNEECQIVVTRHLFIVKSAYNTIVGSTLSSQEIWSIYQSLSTINEGMYLKQFIDTTAQTFGKCLHTWQVWIIEAAWEEYSSMYRLWKKFILYYPTLAWRQDSCSDYTYYQPHDRQR